MKIISLKDKLGNILVPKKWEPIGKILMFDREMIMNQFYYGTWELCLKERSPIGINPDSTDNRFKIAGNQFGEKNHTLTINEIPEHDHNYVSGDFGVQSGLIGVVSNTVGTGAGVKNPLTGGGQAHNNIHPVETVYFYKRVA